MIIKLVKIHKDKFFCALSLNMSYKIHFFFEEKILVTQTHMRKKLNPPSVFFFEWGGCTVGLHSTGSWCIAYFTYLFITLCKLYSYTCIGVTIFFY